MEKKTIALDLGGTRIKIGIVHQGEILCNTLVDAMSDKGLLSRLPFLEESIDKLLKSKGIPLDDVQGIGISIPGIVDSIQMKLLSVNKKFNDAVDFDFPGWAKKRWGLPLVIENDARAALAGEWQSGAGKGCDNLVLVTLGTGVGGAAIIEGKLLHGKHFLAGCLAGHSTINYTGEICNCGNIGCVESEASTWRLPDMAKKHPLFHKSKLSDTSIIDYQLGFELAKQDDQVAKDLLKQSLDAWSAGVINLVHAYDPEMVILGGGIMRSKETILPYIQEKVIRHTWTPWGKVKVVCAENPEWCALQGMDYLLGCFNNQQ
jgi:glucokinase